MDTRQQLGMVGVGVFLLVLGAMGSVLGVAGITDLRAGDDASRPVTEIDACTIITEPGRYVLTADIIDDKSTHLSESCIHIESDDVILDGAGHRIDGRGVSGTIGVFVSSADQRTNVTVTRVTVSDWDWGIYYDGVSRGEVRTVAVRYNGAGVSLEATRDVTVSYSEVQHNGIGMYLLDASDNTIRNTTVSDNLLGVDCEGATATTFASNQLASNNASGNTSAC